MEFLVAIIGLDVGHPAAWQLCVRAAIVLLVGIVFIRIAGRRTFARAAPLDIVVALVLGSNLSRTLTGNAPFLPTLAASLTLAVLHRLLAALAMRWDWLDAALRGPTLVLIRDGRPDQAAMRRVRISTRDLEEAARAHGLERLEQIHLATFEDGGTISVVKRDG